MPGRVTIAGEVSDWRAYSSGHRYFILKDEGGQLPCVMWKSKAGGLKFEVENGLAVLATGAIDVYVPQGRYQLIVDRLQPAGVGALQLAFEQMVRRLEAAGLFDEAHKKPLPAYPERIGILTSESGAAIHDIRDSIFNRWPSVRLFLYPVPVQGEGAAAEIAEAIRDVNRRNRDLKLDLLIVGRGGGSLEDLWAFNEEVLARAIYDSRIPIISAVGHEVDTTIADLVADARASTPTKAGVVAVPDKREVLGELAHCQQILKTRTRWKLDMGKENLGTLLASAVFRNPLSCVRNKEQQLDDLTAAAAEAMRELLARARQRLTGMYEKVAEIEPHRLLGRRAIDLNNLANRAAAGTSGALNRAKMRLTALENSLAAMNPRAVLGRGYSISTNKETGRLVRTAADIEVGGMMVTELAEEDFIESEVKKREHRI